MRVLLVTHYFDDHRGGVEIVAGELARRLADRGVDITWAASGPYRGAAHPRITPLAMKACNVTENVLGVPYPIWGPLSTWRLWREVRRADIVHIHDALYLGNFLAFLGSRRFGKPLVITQHIGMVPYSSAVLRAILSFANHTVARLTLGRAQQAVFISDRVRDYFSHFVTYRHESLLIPNGVATALFKPLATAERIAARRALGWTDEKLRMLFVGRFVEKKGLPLVRELAAAFPQLEWIFAGWGPLDPAAWQLANVTCPGTITHQQLAAYYQAADLLVLPSVGEGFPLVVQEAMACGTPALISDETARGSPGIDRVAYVAPPAAEPLVKLVAGLVANPDALRAHREEVAAFAHANWNWDACADRYRELFDQLLIAK